MNKQNQIKKSTGLRLMSAVTAATFSFASFQAMSLGAEDEMLLSPLAKEFKALDNNRDDKLTRDEVKTDKDIALNFGKADSNSDGVLALDEYENYKSVQQQKNVSLFIDDATITARIKADLLKDNGIKGMKISVETHKGEVILSGFVETDQQMKRALVIASSVRGVQSVKNALVVKG